MINFNVLDDLPFTSKIFLCVLCALGCCWGFVTNSVLLVFASKVGFPVAVVICSINNNVKNLIYLTLYSLTMILVGFLYFYLSSITLSTEITRNFEPSLIDFILAIGLGLALTNFWNHVTRVNIVVMIAGMASLSPACVVSGYWLSVQEWNNMLMSMLLWFEYAVGIFLGSYTLMQINKLKQKR